MSLQAGIWNFDRDSTERELLVCMSQKTAEFEFDGEFLFCAGPVGVLYRPFHTTAESRLERQPYVTPRGQLLTWNGRLDNRDELILRLSDLLKDDKTDVALAAAAIERWGMDGFAKLIGDWAVSIWNPKKQELILARDYIGVRHLFYYHTSNKVVWCSHLAPLVLCGDRFTPNEEYVAGYFGTWPESHLTPYREIHSVPAGHFVRVHSQSVTTRAHWTFNPRSEIRYKTDKEYEEHFREVFSLAVRRRLQTDSPILAELSGGLDSSSIVCMADEIVANANGAIQLVDTFSSYDPDEPDEDDFHYVKKVEEKRGRIGHHARLTSLGDTLKFTDPHFLVTPGFAEREEFNIAQLNVIAQGKYRVLLTGDGGDELLGQARDPRAQMTDRLLRLQLNDLVDLLRAWSASARRSWLRLLIQAFILAIPTMLRTRLRPVAYYEPWLNTRFARKYRITDRFLTAATGKWIWLPTVREAFQSIQTLSAAMTNRRPSRIEKRHPFLDQTLVEFVSSLPADQLLRPGQRRSLVRRSLMDIVPREVLSRKTKSSAGRCNILCLQKHWTDLEALFATPITAQLGYVNADRFEAALLNMKNGHVPRCVVQLLRALSLELWLRDGVKRGIISIPNVIGQDLTHDLQSAL